MKNVEVVLVRPLYERNVGMVARCMSNFGSNALSIIAPQCDLQTSEARQGAAQGQDPLKNAKTYNSWDDFFGLAPEGLRIAFSRREGKRRPALEFSALLQQRLDSWLHQPVYLIFGPEDKGLSEEDLNWVHHMAYLEAPGQLQSFNLSHAVVYALALWHQGLKTNGLQAAAYNNEDRPSVAPLESSMSSVQVLEQLEKLLVGLGYDLSRRNNMFKSLRRVILSNEPTPQEIKRLNSVLTQILRHLD